MNRTAQMRAVAIIRSVRSRGLDRRVTMMCCWWWWLVLLVGVDDDWSCREVWFVGATLYDRIVLDCSRLGS
jgi:hypothetical protein